MKKENTAATTNAKEKKISLENPMNEITFYVNGKELTAEEYCKTYITEEYLFTYECDWWDEDLIYYHNKHTGVNHIGGKSGICIDNCPEFENLDLDLVMMAVECHLYKYCEYMYMKLNYDSIEETVTKLYNENY